MKIVFSLIMIAIVAFTTAVYFDQESENQVYDFCRSHAIGNKISQVMLNAEKNQWVLEQPDSSTLLLIKNPLLPLSKSFICEIKHQQQKITTPNSLENGEIRI